MLLQIVSFRCHIRCLISLSMYIYLRNNSRSKCFSGRPLSHKLTFRRFNVFLGLNYRQNAPVIVVSSISHTLLIIISSKNIESKNQDLWDGMGETHQPLLGSSLAANIGYFFSIPSSKVVTINANQLSLFHVCCSVSIRTVWRKSLVNP